MLDFLKKFADWIKELIDTIKKFAAGFDKDFPNMTGTFQYIYVLQKESFFGLLFFIILYLVHYSYGYKCRQSP